MVMAVKRYVRVPWICCLAAGVLTHSGCLSPNRGLQMPGDLPSLADNPAPPTTELPPAKNAQLNWSLGEALEKNGNDADAAACYEKARSQDPRLPNLARRLAAIYDRLGDSKRALEQYQLALKAAPRDPHLLNRFGYFYYTRGQWSEAETQFRQAVAINANLQCAWVNLGLTLAQQNRYEESVDAFSKAVTRAEALSNLAFVLSTQGKPAEAKQCYREALDLDPKLNIARLALQKLEGRGAGANASAPRLASDPSAVADNSDKQEPGLAPAAPEKRTP
jgi:Tfp pilus assembly protein PilF